MILKTQPPNSLGGNMEEDLQEIRRVLALLIAELNYVLALRGGDNNGA